MTRRRLTPSEKAAILDRQVWICGCGCASDLNGQRIEFDHVICLALGGSDVPENMQALTKPCHLAKTRLDLRRIAKAKRMKLKHETGRSHRHYVRPILSRGFSGWKRFDGTAVQRRGA